VTPPTASAKGHLLTEDRTVTVVGEVLEYLNPRKRRRRCCRGIEASRPKSTPIQRPPAEEIGSPPLSIAPKDAGGEGANGSMQTAVGSPLNHLWHCRRGKTVQKREIGAFWIIVLIRCSTRLVSGFNSQRRVPARIVSHNDFLVPAQVSSATIDLRSSFIDFDFSIVCVLASGSRSCS
jgi:hypothetical protein